MSWTELTIWAGFLTIPVSVALILVLVARRLRWLRTRPPGVRHIEGIAEIAAQAIPVGGLVLLNFGGFAERVEARALPSNLWLWLGGIAGMLLLFGVHLGRLLMRWQLQQLGDTLDTKSGEFATRA
jgi:hypothetical protein